MTPMREPGCIVPFPSRGQALSQVQRVFNQYRRFPIGICRFCGCSEFNACRDQASRPCGWANVAHTRCNSEACLAKFEKEKGAEFARS